MNYITKKVKVRAFPLFCYKWYFNRFGFLTLTLADKTQSLRFRHPILLLILMDDAEISKLGPLILTDEFFLYLQKFFACLK